MKDFFRKQKRLFSRTDGSVAASFHTWVRFTKCLALQPFIFWKAACQRFSAAALMEPFYKRFEFGPAACGAGQMQFLGKNIDQFQTTIFYYQCG